MHKGDQKTTDRGLKYIAIRPATYDKLIELGSMQDSFNDVITEVMKKAGIAIAPDYHEQDDKQ